MVSPELPKTTSNINRFKGEFVMQISLLGIGSETLLADFDSAGVKYIRNDPPVGVAMNAGNIIQILKDISDAIPWKEIAAVLMYWVKCRSSRRLTLTKADNKILHIEGYNSEELQNLLPSCKILMAIETKKPNEYTNSPTQASTGRR